MVLAHKPSFDAMEMIPISAQKRSGLINMAMRLTNGIV
eukprot:CAMPEP_0168760860 /NCGR_PEP_ID=MMETSP0724-20121128/22992_1 /TAXON_ID=265536 /ORGANISM="Amphiprora sp., Strain CCMP467" /LENGTH=37 /DNA_ID= /DNA_START= /DNA_END= /DNA_ORIENTATION=